MILDCLQLPPDVLPSSIVGFELVLIVSDSARQLREQQAQSEPVPVIRDYVSSPCKRGNVT